MSESYCSVLAQIPAIASDDPGNLLFEFKLNLAAENKYSSYVFIS